MNWQYRWQSFAVFSVSFLAVSVSLGVAMVSMAKLLLLIAVVGQLFFDVKHRSFPSFKLWPSMTWWILLAMVWMSLSFLWTESSSADALAGWGRHSRILWFIPVLYLLRSPEQSLLTLKWFVAGMVVMMLSSWALVAGLPVPWASAKELPSLGIVHGQELSGVNRVLTAAALTYVAGTLQTIANLAYYIFQFIMQTLQSLTLHLIWCSVLFFGFYKILIVFHCISKL
jgi:hypothetical protein